MIRRPIAVLLGAIFFPGVDAAVPLSALTGGGTLTAGDVKFGAFSFADIGGSAVDPARINVNASATADTVTLSFFFANGSGAQLLGEAFFRAQQCLHGVVARHARLTRRRKGRAEG